MFKGLKKKLKWFNPYISNVAGGFFLSASFTYIRDYKFISNLGDLKFWVFEHLFCNPFLGLFLGFMLMLAGSLSNFFREKDNDLEVTQKNKDAIDNIMMENQKLKESLYSLHKKNVDTWIKGMYKLFDFKPTERLSIYFYYCDCFTLLARHSSDPEKKATHNPTHPIGMGILGQIWKNGQCADINCPVYDKRNDKIYLEYMERKYGYSSERTKEMNMKSCRYFGMSIKDSDDNIGIILFESTEEGSLDKEIQDRMIDYCKSFESHLCNFIKDSIFYEDEKQRILNLNPSTEQDFITQFKGEKHE